MTRLAQVAIVVPARDEQTLLPGCLDALAVAVESSPLPTRTIVVLDRCTDRSGEICRRRGIDTIEVGHANVGRTRHAGVTQALHEGPSAPKLWIANTDADSRVPPDWIAEQVRLADEGADAVLGLVEIHSDVDLPALRVHQVDYGRRLRADGSHSHVHGANLGIRASTYQRAGGFPPLTDHEDRQLVSRVHALHSPVVVTTTTLRVKTSSRTLGRCDAGFARDIARLSGDAPPLAVAAD
jgi:glycosyltransferase involved in cell wall biosynthesis